MAGSTLIVAGLRKRLFVRGTCVYGALIYSYWIKISQKRIFSHLHLLLPCDLNFVVEWQQQYYLVSSCRPPWLLTYDKVAYNTTKFKTLSREELLLNSPQSSAKAHPYCREASFDSLHSVFWSTNALQI